MEGTQAPDEFGGVDADDAMLRHLALKDFEGKSVVGIAVRREQHDAIGDVEIGVAGGETLAVVLDGPGHGQFDDAERLARGILHGVKPFEILLEDLEIGVLRILFDDGGDSIGIEETGEIIDMTIGVIADDAIAEPKDL